ncbi:Sec39-domain-containing protein [Hysterangium stoloniferum]|nr:Sec39-domain-containing protein [Hysterangium stoloniferum]
MSINNLCTQWLELQDAFITADKVNDILGAINDDPWVAAACADKILDDVVVERALLDLGIQRTLSAVERSKNAMTTLIAPGENDEEDDLVQNETEIRRASLMTHFTMYTSDELLCHLRIFLLERLDRLQTYVEISKIGTNPSETEVKEEPMDAWDDEDDPWEEAVEEGSKTDDNHNNESVPYLQLSSFLRRELIHTALFLASNVHIKALTILLQRHAKSLHAHRLRILKHIPEHVHPLDFQELLPAIDPSTDSETNTLDTPWRDFVDWTETAECTSAFTQLYATGDVSPSTPLHTISEVSQWYQERITQADNAGLVDVALALVQHGASQGVPDLDALGEELGLLTRLVYDTPHPLDEIEEDWTLARWRALSPAAVVQAYLAYSSPETVADSIRRLVMPYLYVLEARAERAGHPDPDIVNRLLYEYVLQTPLQLSAAIFDSSKPTLPNTERLVKNDEDMARLALACLYGSDNRDDWAVMSKIFECLPAWGGLDMDDGDEADTTLASLGDFVIPTTSRPRCTPQELFIFFGPLTASALSRVLDVLDVHLESGEILSRWNVPAPLRWFLQSANDEAQQRAWATRMSRRAGNDGEEPKDEDEWLDLLEDMLKLVGGGDEAPRGAFGLLTKEEVTQIFFSGLLSSGNFRVAKSVLRKSRTPYLSDPQIIEKQVLASAREFYDNASVGNFHQGEMKLAYECLTVAKPSPSIQREREFIEATSRICSFNVVSRPGIPISPIEIRLEKDRLSLVAKVLSSTEDAYKHASVILDLVHKLGYRGDVAAEVKTRAMLADAALHAEDFDRAAESTQQMVDIIRGLDNVSDEAESLKEAREVCWHSCFQLGRQTEFHNVEKKLGLLAHALEICAPEHMLDVLSVWRKLEGENLVTQREKLADRKTNTSSRKRHAAPSAAASIRARLRDLQQIGANTGISAPEAAAAAALATRTFKSVAANFPFSVRGRQSQHEGRGSEEGGNNTNEPDHHIPADVSTHAKQAFSRGIGWLIGADEE